MSNKLERVREIILKQYYSNNEKRVANLESRLSEGFADISKQIKGLKEQFDSEIADVKSQIQQDKTERQKLHDKVKYVTDELSKKETWMLKEIAALNQKFNHNNLEVDKDISRLKKKVVDDISKLFNKTAVENIKLEAKLTGLIKHELTGAGQAIAREINQKQKSEFTKIEASMGKLEKEIDLLKEHQEKYKQDIQKKTN